MFASFITPAACRSYRFGRSRIRRRRRIELSTAALDDLGVPCTRSTKYIVSIYRRAATAHLDTVICPTHRAVPLNGVHYTA